MAKVTFTPLLDGIPISEMYPEFMPYSVNGKGTKVVFDDFEESQNKIILIGENINFDGEFFTGGRIEKITFANGDNEVFGTIEGDYKVRQLVNAFVEGGVQGLIEKVFEGNDSFEGSKKADYMLGFGGNDKLDGGKGADFLGGGIGKGVLTGGAGNDIFMFTVGGGKDVIKDFDAIGGEDNQDLIWILNGMSYEVGKNADNDAVITFEDGSSVTLDGVRKNQISSEDFYIPPEMA